MTQIAPWEPPPGKLMPFPPACTYGIPPETWRTGARSDVSCWKVGWGHQDSGVLSTAFLFGHVLSTKTYLRLGQPASSWGVMGSDNWGSTPIEAQTEIKQRPDSHMVSPQHLPW